MDYGFLRVFIPVYFALFLMVCFLWRWISFFKMTGKNPIILHSSESAHGYLARILAYFVTALAVIVVIFCCSQSLYQVLMPFNAIYNVQAFGIVLLLVALIMITIAQSQMGTSFRIGIDDKEKTSLVHKGLYKYSRNPIYLGMELTVIGLFFVIPNVATLLTVILAHITLQVEIRLEEAHLSSLHGESFKEYCKQVRRWI